MFSGVYSELVLDSKCERGFQQRRAGCLPCSGYLLIRIVWLLHTIL